MSVGAEWVCVCASVWSMGCAHASVTSIQSVVVIVHREEAMLIGASIFLNIIEDALVGKA